MVAAVVAVIASYGVAGPVSSAAAASLAGSTFEIDTDANLTTEGAAPALDWLDGSTMRTGVIVTPDLPSGSSDDSYKGTAEDDTDPTVDTGSIPPSKSDLKDFGIYKEITAADVFVNVFWTRVQDPSGTTNLDFEFNQSGLTYNKPVGSAQVIPVRTAGDLLVTYDVTNGGTTATISKRTWSGSAWGAATAMTSTTAIGDINDTAITAANSGGLGGLDARTFGETSLNLATLVPVASQGCTTFGSVFLKSRSSDAFNAELKDFIAPHRVSISNCGTVNIHKTDDNGALAGAEFTLYEDVAPVGGSKGAGDTVVAGTCTTDAAGDCSIPNVKKGEFWVVETGIPAGHDGAPDQHVSITAGDQVVNLTFNDPVQKGTITVVKDADPDDAQDFGFTLDGNAFTLDDDADGTLPSTQSFLVPVGSHSLVEGSNPTGWGLTDLVCSDPTSNTSVSVPNRTATISLAKNETVTCTFTNSASSLDPALQTQVVSAGGGAWDDTATMTGDGSHAITGSVAFFACAAAATATPCTTGGTQVGTAASVTHTSGATYSAATTSAYTPSAAGWTCFRAELTSTSAFYASSTHTNATTECFLKQAQNLTVSKTATAAFGRVYSWTIQKAVDHSTASIPAGGTNTSSYDVTVGNTHVDGAWSVSGSITVTNPNPVPFSGVSVTDTIDNGAGSCAVTGGTSVTVPANGTAVLPYLCTYTSAPSPSSGTNTATATWDAATYFTPLGTASGTAPVNFASVTPGVTDESVSVTDSVKGVLGTVNAVTDPNPKVFSYTVDRAGVAGTCTNYPNTATYTTNDTETPGSSSALVRLCVGSDLTAGVTATGGKDRDDQWTITKDVDKTSVNIAQGGTATFSYSVTVTPNGSVDSGFSLTGMVTATNPNDWESVTADLTVSSTVGGGASCTVTNGTGVSVPASGNVSRAYSCTFTGTPSNGTVTGHVVWSASAASTPGSSASGSAAATFALGSETHKTITVVDDKTDPANPVTLGTRDFADGPHTYTYSLSKSGVAGACTSYTNTATISETGQSASKTVTVCVGLDLTVSKTAQTSNHRMYLWTIDKSVDKASQSVPAGGTATFGYSVTVTPSGTTDDGWSVTGQITVANPNDWEAITADATDSINTGGGGACSIAGNPHVVVPALGQVTLPYSCTFTSKPADGTNTATATWDAATYATPHGTATGAASVTFVPSSQTNETITVVDDKTDPSNPVTLGTWSHGSGPHTFTYSIDKQGVPGTCTDYTNTARINETGQSDSQVARLCVGSGLTTAATSDGSYDRDDLWSITKSVDESAMTGDENGVATFTYTVTASPAGVSDSGHLLNGTVTASNPNDWQDVVADLTVTTDLGASCVVADGAGVTVPKGGTVTRAYSCTFSGTPLLTGVVTASAAWDAVAAATPVASASATVPTTLVLGNESHGTVTIADDKTDAAHPVTLGTAVWAAEPTSFTYTLEKPAGEGCQTYTNVATIVETQQSASQDVEVCPFTGGSGSVIVPTPGGGGLPVTGDLSGMLARWALAMLGAGAMLLLLSRRRQA